MTDYLTLAYVLIAVGLMLLVADLFVPSFGLFTLVAVALIIGGVVLTFYFGEPTTFILTLVGVFLALPLLAIFSVYYWPRTPIGRYLSQTPEPEAGDSTAAFGPEQLRGHIGKALSPLRPSGVVDFEHRRVDVITEGMMVEAGQWVRCIDVKGGRVVVRPVAGPNLKDLEEADFT
jgi:membrane-bound ClpP family serine protease